MARRVLPLCHTSLLALAAITTLCADMILAGPSAIGDSSAALEAMEAIPEIPGDLSLLLGPTTGALANAAIEAPTDLDLSVVKDGDKYALHVANTAGIDHELDLDLHISKTEGFAMGRMMPSAKEVATKRIRLTIPANGKTTQAIAFPLGPAEDQYGWFRDLNFTITEHGQTDELLASIHVQDTLPNFEWEEEANDAAADLTF